MVYSRREFLGVVSTVAAVAGSGALSEGKAGAEDDPLGARADFPVARENIYLNSPYIAPSPRPVIEKTTAFLEAKMSAPVSLGSMLNETQAARQKFARLVGASEREIAMLSTTTEGENLVVASLDLKSGDNVVIDDLHYVSSYVLYNHLARTYGVDVRIVRNRDGAATVEDFAKQTDEKTKLISVAWVSHQNGYRHDPDGLATLAHSHGALLYADAIQGVGMLPLDVTKTAVDFFTTGTYKWLLGGYGVALFFIRESLLDRVPFDRLGWRQVEKTLPDYQFELYRDARKFEYATPAFTAIYQISAALDYIMNIGVDRIERHTVALAGRLHEGLSGQGFRLRTPAGNGSAIVAFEHGAAADTVRSAFEKARIQVSFREENTQIRVGPALFNNTADIDRFLEVTGSFS